MPNVTTAPLSDLDRVHRAFDALRHQGMDARVLGDDDDHPQGPRTVLLVDADSVYHADGSQRVATLIICVADQRDVVAVVTTLQDHGVPAHIPYDSTFVPVRRSAR